MLLTLFDLFMRFTRSLDRASYLLPFKSYLSGCIKKLLEIDIDIHRADKLLNLQLSRVVMLLLDDITSTYQTLCSSCKRDQ
jgi:hypothetical protein